MTTPIAQCSDSGCTRPARMAFRTTRPSRNDLRTTVFYDDRSAPSTAQRYCRKHGLALITDVIRTVVAEDGPPETPTAEEAAS